MGKWPGVLPGSTRHVFTVCYLEAYSVQFIPPANEPRNAFTRKELSPPQPARSQGHRTLLSKATFRCSHSFSLCSRGVTSEGCWDPATGYEQGVKEAPGPKAPPFEL